MAGVLAFIGCDEGFAPEIQTSRCESPGQQCGAPACIDNAAIEFVCVESSFGLDCRGRPVACDGECRQGICVPPDSRCGTPGEACGAPLCDEDNAVRAVCNGDFVCEIVREPCDPNEVCSGGACALRPGACDPPGAQCAPSDCARRGNIVVEGICQADGFCVEQERVCALGEFCERGQCIGQGVEACAAAGQLCPPAARCDGNVALRGVCSAPGLCVQERVNCGAGLCRNGVCEQDSQCPAPGAQCAAPFCEGEDRKSTRLNSSQTCALPIFV